MSTESAAPSSTSKRPNGRTSANPTLAWLRRGMQVTSWVAPSAAAALADTLFFRPVGARVRDDERKVLEEGREFRFPVGRTQVVGWSWGSGPPVLLAHGWAGHAGQMTGQVPALLAGGFRAVALDMPGHGRSEGSSSSIVHFADAICAAHDTFGPFHGVIAHSLGAGALTYALGRGLPLDQAVFFAPPGDLELFWSRFRAGLGISPPIWSRMQQRAETRLGVRFEEIVPLRHAPHLTTRLRVFHDEQDREIPLSAGEELVAAWPGATLVRTRGLGHLKILKAPELAAQAVAFLQGTEQLQPPGPHAAVS